MDNQRKKDIAWAFVIALTLVAVLGYFFDPRWETNDDIGMSMVAHGYGIAATGSPNLIFSNVIWGFFVRSIPQVNGVLGYSIATLGVLVALLGVAMYTDHLAYQGKNWKDFNKLNPARARYTDFGAGRLLKQHPEILARHNYSKNDIILVANWFFVDPSIANPDALNTMFEEIGPLPDQKFAFTGGWAGIKALAHPSLAPYVFLAIVLLVLQPSRKLFLAWGLCLTAFFALGVLGRPGVIRVYVPVMTLLIIVPLLAQSSSLKARGSLRHRLGYGLIIIVAAIHGTATLLDSKVSRDSSMEQRTVLRSFPTSPVIVWGAVFPYEAVYPVLKQSDNVMNYQLYALGAFTLAPFSRAHKEQREGRGLMHLIASPTGLPVMAAKHHIALLNGYCNEHFSGALNELSKRQYGHVSVAQLRCDDKVLK